MVTKLSTGNMTREEWLLERRKSLGGSDLGAILGLNPWASPYSVWANKTGRVQELEPNEAMRQGTDLEEYVARRFSERSGLRVARENAILRNDQYPHLHADIDRRIVGMRAGLECKTASALNASRFTGGEFPESYYAQCVGYMAVTGYSRYYLAVLVLGREFKIYQLAADPEAETPEWCVSSVYVSPEEFTGIRAAVLDFWEYVEQDKEPPADSSAATTAALERVHADAAGGEVDLFGQEAMVKQYLDAVQRKKDAERAAAMYGNILKQYLGDADQGRCDRYTVTWKPQTRRTFDTKRFIAEHPGMNLDGYYKTSTFRNFTVREH